MPQYFTDSQIKKIAQTVKRVLAEPLTETPEAGRERAQSEFLFWAKITDTSNGLAFAELAGDLATTMAEGRSGTASTANADDIPPQKDDKVLISQTFDGDAAVYRIIAPAVVRWGKAPAEGDFTFGDDDNAITLAPCSQAGTPIAGATPVDCTVYSPYDANPASVGIYPDDILAYIPLTAGSVSTDDPPVTTNATGLLMPTWKAATVAGYLPYGRGGDVIVTNRIIDRWQFGPGIQVDTLTGGGTTLAANKAKVDLNVVSPGGTILIGTGSGPGGSDYHHALTLDTNLSSENPWIAIDAHVIKHTGPVLTDPTVAETLAISQVGDTTTITGRRVKYDARGHIAGTEDSTSQTASITTTHYTPTTSDRTVTTVGISTTSGGATFTPKTIAFDAKGHELSAADATPTTITYPTHPSTSTIDVVTGATIAWDAGDQLIRLTVTKKTLTVHGVVDVGDTTSEVKFYDCNAGAS